MPQHDRYIKNHGSSYFDDKIIASEDSAKNIMGKFSIHPPDDADGQKGTKGIMQPTTRDDGPVRLGKMVTGLKVANLHLTKQKRGGTLDGNEGADALYGKASYLANAPGFPTWFLPWDTDGAIIKLRIPKKGQSKEGRDPDRFFTAAINGCSIFFEGAPDNPIIYHAGGVTSQPTAADGAKFWRDIMALHTNQNGEVNKTDYIKNDAIRDSLNRNTSQAAQDYETWLRNNHSSSLEISEVSPWGCVMGMRDAAGNWKFYLQENATITYFTLKKKSLFSSTKVREKEPVMHKHEDGKMRHKFLNDEYVYQDRKRRVSRPIKFREVWPTNNGGAVRYNRFIPSAKHG